MNTVNCNPVEALRLLNEMDLTNRAYLGRSVVSSLNAMIVGQLAQVARQQQIGVAPGIDGLNDALAAALEREVDNDLSDQAGLETNDPSNTAGALFGCVSAALDNLDLSINLREAINRPYDTVKFLASREPEKADQATAAKLATALNIAVEDATRAITQMNLKRHNDFQKVAGDIPELIEQIEEVSEGFEALPNRMKMRVAQKIEQHLSSKLTNEIQRVITMSADNMGDIPMMKAALAAVKKWVSDHSDTDELARQLRAAA